MALETIFSIVAEPLVQYVVAPTARHISYAFRCSSKIAGLQNQVGRLKNKMLERQQLVDNATSNGEEIFPAVTEWLTAAGKEIEDAEQLIRGEAQAMMLNKCFAGLCPDMKARYQLSKRAHKKALQVSEKLQEAQGSGSGPVSFRPPLQQISEPSVYSSEALPSRVLILNQIMDALKDPGLNTIGVYGMGGIGKTTLAKEVKGRAAQEKSLFETVVMVAVSQAPDLRRIQGEIADLLGLKFDGEEIPGRAYRLHKRLERAKALIILDDVWQRLDLTAVGVPLGGGCKIFVTSRRKDVLSTDMGTQKDFSLDALEEEETWRLFEMSTSSITDPELHQTAKEVAKKCAGLPLLILKVAADLRGKQSYAWTDMLIRLSSLENTEIYEKVHRVIESSYEKLLDEEAKSLFLLCALFGDSKIEIQRLVMYCVGLGLFKRIGTIEGSRNRVLSLIDKLKDECLLLDGDTAGFVKMHDVVHDIAVAIASRVQNAYVGAGEHFRNEDCTRISFPRWDTTTSKLPGVLECPQAELISLFANGNPLDVSGSFFKGAPMLKVVDFTGVWFGYRLPSSLCYLTGLQTLCLQGCRFEDVAVVAELKQLEVLSLAGSFVLQALPGEIKALTRLKLFDLSRCSRLKVIPADVLSNLSSLEELYMFGSFSRWEINSNASLEELKSLSHLKTLEIRVKDDKLIPKEWFFDGVQNYKISIGRLNLLQDTARYKTSRKILQLELKTSTGSMHRIKEFVNGIEVLKLHDVGVETLLFDSEQYGLSSFGKLRDLGIFDCLTLKSLFSHSFAKYLPQLEALEVVSCAMEAIVGVDEEEIEFTHLKHLTLGALPYLISLSKSSSATVAFPNLTSLLVSECDGLKYIFTASMMNSLKQLKSLCISHCKLMGEIISSEQIEEEKITRIVFPKLESLELAYLKKLKRFSSRHPIDFPSLRVLTIYDCPEIENLVSKFPERSNDRDRDDDYLFLNELVSLNNLEELEVSGVDNLRYLWSEGINMQNLRSITVRCCPRLRYVFRASVACGLHQLRLLRIQECGVYTIIAKEKDKTLEVKWPCLTDVEVRDCNVLFEFGSNNSELFSHVKDCTLDDHSLQAIRSDGIRVDFLLREDKV